MYTIPGFCLRGMRDDKILKETWKLIGEKVDRKPDFLERQIILLYRLSLVIVPLHV